MEKLANRLKEARNSLNLSQEYVANQLELNRTSIVQIESGKRKVSAEELQKFADLYGFSIDELVKGKKVEMPELVFARGFSELSESDQREILSLIEFKKMIKEQRLKNA